MQQKRTAAESPGMRNTCANRGSKSRGETGSYGVLVGIRVSCVRLRLQAPKRSMLQSHRSRLSNSHGCACLGHHFSTCSGICTDSRAQTNQPPHLRVECMAYVRVYT